MRERGEPRRKRGGRLLRRLLLAVLGLELLLAPPGLAAETMPAAAGEPLTLARCLVLADACSLEVKGARERLRVAETFYQGTLSDAWPQVQLLVDYVQKSTPLPDEADPVRPRLAVSKATLNDWGNIHETRAALTSLAEARANLARLGLESRRVAGERYFQLLIAQELAAAARTRAQKAAAGMAEQEEAFRGKGIPPVELLRNHAAVSRAQVDLLTRERELALARQALASALCLPSGSLPIVLPDAKEGPDPDPSLCLESALATNPELMALRASLANIHDLEESARLARWPKLGARGYLGHNTDDGGGETDWELVLTLSYDLLDRGEVNRRVAETVAETRWLETELRRREKEIREEMESLFLDLAFAGKVLVEMGARKGVGARLLEMTGQEDQRAGIPWQDFREAQALMAEQESAFSLARNHRLLIRFRILLLAGLLRGEEALSNGSPPGPG